MSELIVECGDPLYISVDNIDPAIVYAGTIEIGTVTTGSDSAVTNSGDEHNAIFNFVLEKGDAATIAVGTVTNGSDVSVTNVGTSGDAIFDFVLEKGDAATVAVGTVTDGATASVTNVGTVNDAIFDFVLKQGVQGISASTGFKIIADDVVLATGTNQLIWTVPSELNNYYVTAIKATVTTVSSSGNPTITITNITDTVDITGTAYAIPATAFVSTSGSVSATNQLATNDRIGFNVTVAGTGAKGLQIDLIFSVTP